MQLSLVQESIILAAYFRGGSNDDYVWRSNSDQILTLSLFYTGDISAEDCEDRFAEFGYVKKLYVEESTPTSDEECRKLAEGIDARYRVLIQMIRENSDLIQGAGNLDLPSDPTFTSCKLTDAGYSLALTLGGMFPLKPEFENWPDRRTMQIG